MLTRVLILLLLLIVIPDTYIYFTYVRKWTDNKWKRMLTFLPSLILVVYFFLVYAQDDMRAAHQPPVGTFIMLFFLITVPKMLFTIFDSLGLASRRVSCRLPAALKDAGEDIRQAETERREARGNVIHRYVRLFAMSIALCSAFIIIYGTIWGRNNYQVNNHSIYFQNLPDEFDGYRILQFSDLHIGTFDDGHRNDVDTIVSLINKQKCDLVVFTGDIVNYEAAELDGYDDVLSKIKAPDGVLSILGNHDYDMYLKFSNDKEKAKDMAAIKQKQRDYGWELLLNDNKIIHRGNDSIAIIGSENDGLPPWPALGDMPKATKGLTGLMKDSHKQANGLPADHTFSVLLTHDPTYWRRHIIPDTNIDLTLAGHTHAGQFKIFGWSPIKYKYDEWSGFYSEGYQIINVNDGIGQILLPFRFGAWPEVDIITLKKEK